MNKYQNRGAVGMLGTDLLEKFAEQGGCDLYILPSSIHEVLLLKDDEMPVDELRKVVRSVNRGMVDEMENRIRERRKELGLSQKELAQKCGVSRQTVNAIENNKYDPTLSLAFHLARELQLTVDELFLPDT